MAETWLALISDKAYLHIVLQHVFVHSMVNVCFVRRTALLKYDFITQHAGAFIKVESALRNCVR